MLALFFLSSQQPQQLSWQHPPSLDEVDAHIVKIHTNEKDDHKAAQHKYAELFKKLADGPISNDKSMQLPTAFRDEYQVPFSTIIKNYNIKIASFLIGKLLLNREPANDQNKLLAIDCLEIAAKEGYEPARIGLEESYFAICGMEWKLDNTLDYFSQIAEKETPEVMHRLGLAMMKLGDIENHLDKAIELFVMAIKQGHGDAIGALHKAQYYKEQERCIPQEDDLKSFFDRL